MSMVVTFMVFFVILTTQTTVADALNIPRAISLVHALMWFLFGVYICRVYFPVKVRVRSRDGDMDDFVRKVMQSMQADMEPEQQGPPLTIDMQRIRPGVHVPKIYGS